MNGLGATYLRIVLSRWKIVLALVLLCTGTAWAISVFYLATKPTFEAAARLNIVPTSEELGYANRFVRGSTFDGGSVLLGTYAEYAHTVPVVAPIVDRFMAEHAAAAGQSVAEWTRANSAPPSFSPGRILAILNYGAAPVVPLRQDLIDSVIKGTTIENIEGTYLMRLAVEWDDPRQAAWFANALADAIITRAERMSRSSGQGLAGTLQARLDAKRAALNAMLNRSRSLKASIGVVDIDRQKQGLIEARLTEQAALTTDRANLDSAESQVAALRRQTGGKLSSAQQVLDNTLAVEAPRAAGLARSVAIRQARIGQLDSQIAGLGGNENRVKSLDDQAALLQAEVAALTERLSFSQTENLANVPKIQLIERATPPLTRSSPKIFLNTALGFVAGCALAGCALLLLGPAPVRTRREDDDDAPAHLPEPAPVPILPELPSAQIHPIRPTPTLATPAPAPAQSWLMHGNAAVALDDKGEAAAEAMPAEAAPAPAAIADRRYPGILPRPADAETYAAAEVAAHARTLSPWLLDLLAPDQRPVFVASAADERDARQLYQLLYSHLRRSGLKVHAVDAVRGAAEWQSHDAKPLVYLGTLADTGRAAIAARLPVDAQLVVALVGPASDDWRRTIDIALPQAAHVVSFGS